MFFRAAIITAALAAPSASFAATVYDCPSYAGLKQVVTKYVSEVNKPGLTQEQKNELRESFNSGVAINMIAIYGDTRILCEMVTQKLMLEQIQEVSAKSAQSSQ